MKSLPLARLKRWGWNRRILTLDKFYDFCEAESILLIERPYEALGRYDEPQGRPRIRLSTRPPAVERLHVAWHEAAHYAFHTPGNYGHSARTELEADCVADCALLPRALLGRYTRADWAECGYPHWLVERRLRWWEMWRL